MLRITFLFTLLFVSTLASVQADPWDGLNNPANLSPSYQYKFDQLPLEGRVDEAHMPWSDNYWESDWGGISLRWNTLTPEQLDPEGTEWLDKYEQFKYTPPTKNEVKGMSIEQLKKLSPAEKYDILMSRYDYPTVKSERERTDPNMKDWQGICHGWVPAAINHAEPQPTEGTNAEGVVVPFGSTDVKGLLSYYYGVPAYDYARGNRKLRLHGGMLQFLDQVDSVDLANWISVPPNMPVFVAGYSVNTNVMTENEVINGSVESLNFVGQIGKRPEKHSGKTMRDPNAGAFHVVMTNQLALMKRAFIGNINKKLKNAEIWNQPIVGYTSEILREKHRRNGESEIKMRTVLTYVSEIPQLWEPVIGTDKQRYSTMEFEYKLELRDGVIVGGTWDDKAKHPSFAWKHDKLPIRGYFKKINDIYRSRF